MPLFLFQGMGKLTKTQTMFSSCCIPSNHPLHHLPKQIQSLVYAFARPQLPSDLRQHITRVHSTGTALAQWIIEHICTDLSDLTPHVRWYWKSPFAKVAPCIQREWTSLYEVELCPHHPNGSCYAAVMRGNKQWSDIVVGWLMARLALPLMWDTIIETIEDEDTLGYFGVVRKCRHIVDREGHICLRIQFA